MRYEMRQGTQGKRKNERTTVAKTVTVFFVGGVISILSAEGGYIFTQLVHKEKITMSSNALKEANGAKQLIIRVDIDDINAALKESRLWSDYYGKDYGEDYPRLLADYFFSSLCSSHPAKGLGLIKTELERIPFRYQ